MKLKIFSDQCFLPDRCEHPTLKYVPILFPFWGKTFEDPEDFRTGRFDEYAEIGKAFLEMTPLEKADLVIFPAYWHLIQQDEVALARAMELIALARQAQKPVAIFVTGDWRLPLPADNVLVFFTASFRSQIGPNEFAMPEWSVDFIKESLGGQISIRQKQMKPTVGFCGYAPPLGLPFGKKRLRATVRLISDQMGLTRMFFHRTGHTTRVRALSTLSKSRHINTNFVLRKQFAFTSQGMQGVPDDRKAHARQLRLDFCQNLVDSDYILCASGYENYSIRFYETLSCGRIPIFIDTDCVLPFDFTIDWKQYCVWINERELPFIAEKVADFHSRLSPQDFIDLQHECRKLWQQWIAPEGFFFNLYHCVQRSHLPSANNNLEASKANELPII